MEKIEPKDSKEKSRKEWNIGRKSNKVFASDKLAMFINGEWITKTIAGWIFSHPQELFDEISTKPEVFEHNVGYILMVALKYDKNKHRSSS